MRILLIPFFVIEMLYFIKTGNDIHRKVALGIFGVAAVLDGVDGYVARRFHQISDLGTVLDPMADKLLLVSSILLLSFNHAPWLGQMPLWLTGTILGRDCLLAVGSGVIYYITGTVHVKPHMTGKVATVLQMLTVVWLLLRLNVGAGAHSFMLCALAAAICTGISGIFYTWDGVQQLSSHPASSPKAKPLR